MCGCFLDDATLCRYTRNVYSRQERIRLKYCKNANSMCENIYLRNLNTHKSKWEKIVFPLTLLDD
jgi:hypothetical protein